MKDNISLIAAAAGGFMLSVTLAGILHGAPVTAWREQSNLSPTIATNVSVPAKQTDDFNSFVNGDAQKS
ncbi:hypothetical protein CLI64_10485 [Nostoc sp. CENA543]|uniref:hypothetical protein n=1 Tax=Nostoc sp. CENA543 TaxID=1869241 RepID=UPI000CA20926|nr:hypothetical protein [Nostoc sp. CENA543]AUT00788.1 hypothetical protein CLI64_10485 [Nostoc sp. CENA543]